MKKYTVKTPTATYLANTTKSNVHHIITATEASRSLSDILNKVHYQGQSFDIKRGKEIIAQIIPNDETTSGHSTAMFVTELNEFFKSLPYLDDGDCEAFANTLKEIRHTLPDEKNPWD